MNTPSEFEQWWARHHPRDWFSKDCGGEPVPTVVRLHVWNLCRSAWLHKPPAEVPSGSADERR